MLETFGILNIWAYALGALIIVMIPGPNTLFVLKTSIVDGRRAGFTAAAGVFTGDYDTFTVKSGKRTNVKVEADAWQIALGYDYPLSKRTYLYAAASYVDRTYKENGKEVSGPKKTDTVRAAMLGICHSF